jgi:hypothetical protein
VNLTGYGREQLRSQVVDGVTRKEFETRNKGPDKESKITAYGLERARYYQEFKNTQPQHSAGAAA